MKGPSGYAFGNARVRALASALLGPDAAARLSAARTAPLRQALAAELGIGADAFARLMSDYRKVYASYPDGQRLWRALLVRHEAENLKLLLRAAVHVRPAEEWRGLWRDLGALQTLKRELWAEARSLPQLRERARKTAWEDIVGSVTSAAESDLGAAELALDVWVSRQLRDAALALPERERAAKELVLLLVRERDQELRQRGPDAFHLPKDVVASAVALPDAPPASTDELRRLRRVLCRRAFIGAPFRLAPAVAFLLLREEELRGVAALVEGPGSTGEVDLRRVLAAGALGG